MNEITTGAGPGETLVVVTGGTGYVGGHVVARLLRDGHRVRTTVRSAGRDAEVRAIAAAAGVDPRDRLSIAVAELDSPYGWAEAMRGADHVLHVASPFPAVPPENDDDVIRPAREGTLHVLRAARDAGVRRVVLTSSFAAVGYGTRRSGHYTEEDWTNPEDPNPAYIRSKALAERAAWDFVAEEGGGLELAVVLPTGIFGPVLGDRLSMSVTLVRALLEGVVPPLRETTFGAVDVRDLADIHVRAMTSPDAAGRRFLATAEVIGLGRMAEVLRRELGEAARAVPEIDDAARREAAGDRPFTISTERARTVLGWRPRDVDETIADTGRSLLVRGLVHQGPLARR